MSRKIVVAGGGSAGLIAAITLLRVCSGARVRVVRSTAMGHIMVGEGTFAATPRFFHKVMGIPKREFHESVNPTWKLGIRFLWGLRSYFDYPFNEQFDNQILPSAAEPWGYYCLDQWKHLPATAIATDSALLPAAAGYHIENHPFVTYLERHFVALGGELMDARIVAVEKGANGVSSLRLENATTLLADYFIDASGFRAELIHGALQEPYVNLRGHLFCDKAVVGGWTRGPDEPVNLYTTAETKSAGWCWRIEHERVINRGYVYCSAYITDEQAAAEFLKENPKIRHDALRVIPFESRHVKHAWVGNVIAVGNANGFVEPLEATNLQVICDQSLHLAKILSEPGPVEDVAVERYNRAVTQQWENVRDFLALHYRFNTRLDTPFWNMAVHETPLGGLEGYVRHYQEYGPSLLSGEKLDMFGHDGYLALLLGMRVPWKRCEIR